MSGFHCLEGIYTIPSWIIKKWEVTSVRVNWDANVPYSGHSLLGVGYTKIYLYK